jgi:ATPase subunit of ABC transporter with duplicated ATPase domains
MRYWSFQNNNLDLANIEFLESVLREFRGALVVVSHDVQFLENCGVSEELTLRSGEATRTEGLLRTI